MRRNNRPPHLWAGCQHTVQCDAQRKSPASNSGAKDQCHYRSARSRGRLRAPETRLFKLPDLNRLGEQSNKNGPAVLAGPKFAMLRRSALAAGGAGPIIVAGAAFIAARCFARRDHSRGTSRGRPGPCRTSSLFHKQSSAPLRLHRQVRLLDEPGGDLRRGGHKIRERRDRPLRRSRSRRTNGDWLPFGHHSFQVSPAQYPRPVCSRNVMLGPGFQVSS